MNETYYVPRTQKGAFGNIAAWVIALTILCSIVTGSLWAAGVIFAPQIGKGEARKQINSASFRIAAYDNFFNACASIQGLEGQLAAQETALLTATGDDRARIESNIAGIRGARQQAIAEYNADARKSYTLGQFRSSDLPYSLDPAQEATSCVA